MIKVLGITGSLRKGSYNKALLNAAVALKPEDVNIVILILQASRYTTVILRQRELKRLYMHLRTK